MAVVGKMSKSWSSTSRRGDVVIQAQSTCLGLLIAWGYVFLPELKAMLVASIQSTTDRHCVVIPAVFLGLVFIKREMLTRVQPVCSQWGLLMLFIIMTMYMFAGITHSNIWQQSCIVAIVPAIILLSCGVKITKILAFPLWIWFFILPVGSIVTPMVHDFAANMLTQVTLGGGMQLGASNANAGSIVTKLSALDIQSLVDGINYITSFLLLGLIYVYMLHTTFIRSLTIALFFTFLPGAFLLIGVQLLSRIEVLLGINIFQAIGLPWVGWSCVMLGIISSMILGILLKQQHGLSNNARMRDLNWQVGVVTNNFVWMRTLILGAIFIIMMPFVAKEVSTIEPKYQVSSKLRSMILRAM